MNSKHFIHEYPEYEGKINKLRLNDEHFKHLYLNYEEIHDLIQHYEQQEEKLVNEVHLKDLHNKESLLKKEIYDYLQKN